MTMQKATKHQPPVNIAVVGHTNAGKTSLIRTLLRDDRFGEIDDAAGTTRHVEKSAIYASESTSDDASNDDSSYAVIILFDTPGFEDSSALLQTLESLASSKKLTAGIALLQAFLAQAEKYPDFEQENKVLRQALNSDVLLYMIDVREPLLGKYRDEVEILSMAGIPILPVFNFIDGNASALKKWREQMAQFNLHAALEFDTVAFDFEAEKRLYQKLQTLLEHRYDDLQTLIDYRQQIWSNLKLAAAHRIFQLLVDVACYRRETEGKGGFSDKDVTKMQDFVRNAEQQALHDLLTIFAFTRLDIELQQLPVQDGQWELDIFSPQMLKTFGLDVGASALSGAATGAGIDLLVGGMSLGAATLLGATLGAGWATARQYKQEISAVLRGHKWLCVDDNTVALVYLRQKKLLNILTRRGHAAQGKLSDKEGLITDKSEHKLPERWSKVIKVLRQNPHWQQSSHESLAQTGDKYTDLQEQVSNWLLSD